MKLRFHKRGWDKVVKHVIDTEGVDRMRRVAEAANTSEGVIDGFRVSVDGDQPLRKHDYRATVITATGEAMRANAQNNTLVNEFHRAGD